MKSVHCLLLLYLNGFTVIINDGNDENVFRYRRRELDEILQCFLMYRKDVVDRVLDSSEIPNNSPRNH